MLTSKYSVDRNNTIASLYRTQYIPDFLIAEYYGLRNTIFWVAEDLASDGDSLCDLLFHWPIFILQAQLNRTKIYKVKILMGTAFLACSA
jgi:hypothetical protein